jgi:hypothetical protein
VQIPNPLAHLIELAGGLQEKSTLFHEKFISAYKKSLWLDKPCCKRFAAVSTTRFIYRARVYQPGFAR